MTTELTKADSEQVKLIFEYLTYLPESGEFWWTENAPPKVRCRQAFARDQRGYVCFKVGGRMYKAHRLAWLFVHGHFPNGHIDHIDGDITNNRISNLRDVAHSVNMQNQRKAMSSNSSGLLGVSPNGSRWRAEIRVHGKKKYIGTFDTPQQAHEAYLIAKRQHHEGCTI